jgi:hypothetical protein
VCWESTLTALDKVPVEKGSSPGQFTESYCHWQRQRAVSFEASEEVRAEAQLRAVRWHPESVLMTSSSSVSCMPHNLSRCPYPKFLNRPDTLDF